MSDREEILSGGNVTAVSRVGDAVHRRSGPWSGGVQRLLAHLEAAGFDRAPRPLGFDAEGREVVSYLPGEVYNYPLPEVLWSDAVLVQAAELLRDYHEATAGFVPAAGDQWQVAAPADLPREVLCHNDVAPYNVVLRDGRLAGLIDFDMAGPGPRIWDVVYAAYRFVPLSVKEGPAALHAIQEQARRVRLFADAYNLSGDDRRRFVPTLLSRLDAIRQRILDGVAAGEEASVRHEAAGDAVVYQRDAEHVAAHRAALEEALS
ncbi:phosphotransferase [Conexibacter woesei]|uniref:phosphotransferase n=1 Tax=Conexibacter woesei TaxID=191495 RepID=UPI000429127C|nr:phosphotransferase [Conexibacter woesei]